MRHDLVQPRLYPGAPVEASGAERLIRLHVRILHDILPIFERPHEACGQPYQLVTGALDDFAEGLDVSGDDPGHGCFEIWQKRSPLDCTLVGTTGNPAPLRDLTFFSRRA